MIATYWSSLKEALSRRVLVVVLGIAVVTSIFINTEIRFPNAAGVNVVTMGDRNLGPWPVGVPLVLGQQMAADFLWMLLTILAAVPLLVAMLERGWLELIFSKGKPRSLIFLGRFICGATLYYLLALVASLPLAIRCWWVTGVPTWQIFIALLIQTLSFVSILAVAALVSLLQTGVPLPLMAGAGVWYLSPLLAARQENYYPYVTSEVLRAVIDWAYYILPKCSELTRAGSNFIQFSSISTAWPLWTTALFTLGTLLLTIVLLERKSF
jgi:hypothetical protein